MKDYITIVGGGLAGCEAAYQIAKNGIKVKLYEMKPVKFSPAHSNKDLAEVVCSNSFKSNLLTNACGLLKEELVSNVCNGCQNYNYCYININNLLDCIVESGNSKARVI